MYNGFDHNDNPFQFGVHGWEVESDGLTRMNGPALGIVLSVQAADSEDNLLYRMLQSEDASSSKGSQLEASILLIYDGKEIFQEIDHVLILQGKCSQYGPGEREPSDWTEDVPNGCKDDELKEFYGDGGRTAVQNLSGDWVIVDFLGGILQLPMVTHWFPNPNNNRDAATKDLGKRFVLRRNNSEISISKDGDFHITHRDGQYIQMKNKKITIKHREGQIIHLDEDGKVFIASKEGNNIVVDEDGVSLVAGTASSSLDVLDGDGITLRSAKGDIDISSSRAVNLVSPNVTVTGGPDASGNVNAGPLCIEQMAQDFAVISRIVSLLITALSPVPVVGPAVKAFLQQPLVPTDPTKGTVDSNLNNVLGRSVAYQISYLTNVLLGE